MVALRLAPKHPPHLASTTYQLITKLASSPPNWVRRRSLSPGPWLIGKVLLTVVYQSRKYCSHKRRCQSASRNLSRSMKLPRWQSTASWFVHLHPRIQKTPSAVGVTETPVSNPVEASIKKTMPFWLSPLTSTTSLLLLGTSVY